MPLRRSNVDTDQIIPARYCTSSSRTGYQDTLFADWRLDPDFVLSRPEHGGATLLVAGDNFGSGSSRETAVWALADYGFRAIIAPRYGDIFRANSLMNSLLTVTVPEEIVSRLWELIENCPSTEISVDLEQREVRCAGLKVPFTIDDEVRERLLIGLDSIAATLHHDADIAAYERTRRPTPITAPLGRTYLPLAVNESGNCRCSSAGDFPVGR